MPAKDKVKRKRLIEAIADEGRKMSTQTVLYHTVVADRLGLNPSDHKCGDLIINQREPITAGRLAEVTGLSTGAITGVIDRLERAGFVARTADPKDRRRVVLRPTPERMPDVRRFFHPLRDAMLSMCERYSDAELELLIDFMQRCRAVSEAQVTRLRDEPRVPPEAENRVCAHDARRAARIESAGGLSSLAMLIDDIKARMFQAMKAGATVEKEILRVAMGEITTEAARAGRKGDDEEATAILRKLVKSNDETFAALAEGDPQRAVLKQENDVLAAFLPKSLDADAIAALLAPVADAIKAAGNDGQATGVAMKELKKSGAVVNGKDVSLAVKKLRGG